LARVTYGLVGLALIALVLGIFVFDDNNTMLYLSIALSILCIALVVFGAARRAKYVSPEGEVAVEPDLIDAGYESGDTEEVTSDEVLSAFEDADETATWDDDEEEEEDDLEYEDEDVEEVSPRRSATKTKAKPKSKAKAKPKPAPKKAAAKKKAPAGKPKSTRSTSKKVIVVPGRDRYHTAGCRFVKGKDDTEEIAAATAKRRGYEACSVCGPD
jgi:outer membrane biosynthesis protein TonB